MSDSEDIEEGLAQMDYELVDNGVLEVPASTPATYEFVGAATYATDAFSDELDEYDFGQIGEYSTENDDGSFYYTVDVLTDHYKKVSVKVWQDRANIYPKGDYRIDIFEMSRIVHAIENAFESELEHIENNE